MIGIRVAVCDDEQPFRTEITRKIRERFTACGYELYLDEYADGPSFLQEKIKYDLIFMDFCMPNMNGIETIRAIRNQNDEAVVIFISSYPDVALDTFELKAFRFLKKPAEPEKLSAAISDFIKTLQSNRPVLLKNGDTYLRIDSNDIIYVESNNKHCILHTRSDDCEFPMKFDRLIKQLPPDLFVRTHRCCMVNLKYVKTCSRDGIPTTKNVTLPISKERYRAVKTAFFAYQERYAFSR